MIDSETLKLKLKKELKELNLSEDQEEVMVKELNYLSNLLLDVHLRETRNEKF